MELTEQRARRLFPHWATFNLAFHDWDEPIRRTLAATRASQAEVLTPRLGEIVHADQPFPGSACWKPFAEAAPRPRLPARSLTKEL